ncbi:MAG: hypothetical protein QNJ22_20565 [Desulfosarcinaceae bacterium]|nr:hypothetical protein [Desulfosarcinaceae bacterium]
MKSEKTSPQTEEAQRLTAAAQELFEFAIGREELKHIMALLPEAAPVARNTVEYELQLLKIITVGWSITYFLEEFPHKEPLAILFWEAVRGFSQQLSETAGLMIGGEVDYFEVLRARLDDYVDALERGGDAAEPAAVIGPAFARNCDAGDEVFTIMSGSRMFIATTGRVKQMLARIVTE